MYGGAKHIKFQLDLKSANKDTGVRENELVIEDVEQTSNPISNGNRILVDYQWNKERALRKKAAACRRDVAAFEHSKTDLNKWVEKNPQYMIYSETPVS